MPPLASEPLSHVVTCKALSAHLLGPIGTFKGLIVLRSGGSLPEP